MKKITILLLFLTVLAGTASAQKKNGKPKAEAETINGTIQTSEIEIRFNEQGLIIPKSLNDIKPNEYYRIKITDINQNLYKVSINHSDTIVSKALQMPTFASFQLDEVSKVIAGISPGTTSSVLAGLPQYGLYKDTAPSENTKQKIKGTVEQMQDYKIKLEGYLQRLRLIKNGIEEMQLYALNIHLSGLSLKKQKLENVGYKEVIDGIAAARKAISELQLEINAEQNNYLLFSQSNNTVIAENTSLKTTDAEIKSSFSLLLTGCSEASASVNADKLRDLLACIIVTENNSSKTYISMPIQFTKELATVEILVEPRKPEYLLQTYKSTISFPVGKLSYAGVGISFYGASLGNEKYSSEGFQVNDSVTNYRIKAEKKDKWEAGMAALLRLGTKFSCNSNFGIHGTIGPGITISDKVKPRILAGGGLSVGNKHMFTFDLGGIFGYTDTLSEVYSVDKVTATKPESITVSRLKAGFFLSLGYLYHF